jgi:hypothetical protein
VAFLNYFFFYTYIGLVLLAGFWGAFAYPYLEFEHLLEVDLQAMEEAAKKNLLSQYRFLRALEFGYGLFALLFLKEIFSIRKFNLLFLTIMGGGILARIVSWVTDGTPNGWAIFFLSYEAIGWLIIAWHSKQKGLYHAG